jgi:putative ABC transport system permease protein
MSDFLSDIRLTIRTLVRQPGFAAVAILTLALGIGATSAMFSVFKAVVLEPLPFKDPSNLVMVWEHRLSEVDRDRNVVSTRHFREWQTQTRVFASMGAYWLGTASLTAQGDPEEVSIGAAAGDLFATLGARPLLGRWITAEDSTKNATVVVLSYSLWKRKFAADPRIVGQSVQLDGLANTIVGVMPPDFILPDGRTRASADAELWTTLPLPASEPFIGGRFLRVIARLAPGVTEPQAQERMTSIAARLARERAANRNWGINTLPLHDQLVGDVRRPLMVILASVGILLLIACVNVANLLLSRASTRRKEMAIRAALGASRLRLVRQLLTESVVLSTIGGVLGLLLAAWGTALLLRFIPDAALLPRLENISVDSLTVAVTAIVAIGTAILFGLAPALESSRTDLQTVLRTSNRGTTHSRGGKRFRDVLVASEIALAVVLLVSAGLLLKTFKELLDVDPGANPRGALTMKVVVPGSSYSEPHTRVAFYDRLFDRLAAIPGVTHVGATQQMPFTAAVYGDSITIVGKPLPREGENLGSEYRNVGGDYFRAMGMKLVGGRTFDGRDRDRSSRKVIVNDILAKRYFPGESPIGQRINCDFEEEFTAEIIGVVGSVRQGGLRLEPSPALYMNYVMSPPTALTIVISSTGDPSALIVPATRIVREMDPKTTISQAIPLDELIMRTIARPKFNASLLVLFSALGLILAAIGVYGVLSYSVSQRTQEIGVRMALGAQPRQVMKLVSGEGMRIAILGLLAGTAAALVVTRLLRSLLYGVTASDPSVLVLVWVVVGSVALFATHLPSRRATKVDPLVALRAE